MLGTGSQRYHRQSPQYTAAELGDCRKEDERGEREREREEEEEEEEEEAGIQLKGKDRGQGAKCLPRKSRRSVSCSCCSFRACSVQKALG